MKQQELHLALEQVREYFKGREVSINTVLAAYLRSAGLPASGAAWEVAKAGMQAGMGFAEAVSAAREVVDGSSRAAERRHRPQPTPTDSKPAPRLRREVRTEVTASKRGPANESPTPFKGEALQWYPKPFGPGDIDGVGARRLLGTPNIEPAEVLVRETAQNSWDARGAATEIDFVLDMRCLRGATLAKLRNSIFTGDAPRTGLAELLQRDEVWALEISDRGTVGLGGPIRNDLAVDPGEDTNFIDLIFNIGAPRDVHLGAGTYGFGKTIAYVTSGVGTVLIWSRCQGRDGLEDRLIGSAIGDGFNMGDLRYTGRHWWGNTIAEESRVEPVVGALARDFAEPVFASRFDEEATGTSILILDPQLGAESPEEAVALLSLAVRKHLWPKLIPSDAGRGQMHIDIRINGESIATDEPEADPVLSGYASCLQAVRSAQAGNGPQNPAPKYPVRVEEVWLKVPETLLGHLALTRYPATQATQAAHSIAFMRNQAELVVKYFERPQLDIDGFQWAGVFKPVANTDDSFAMAEPPAHDDWVVESISEKPRRREVNVALRRIREIVDDFLSPPKVADAERAESLESAAHVGDVLADLLGGLEGPAASSKKRSSNVGGRRAARPRVELIGTGHSTASRPGWTRTSIDFQLTNAASSARVEVVTRVGIEGGSWDDSALLSPSGWEVGDGYVTGALSFEPNAIHRFTYESRSDLAIDIETKLGSE